jgi:hypothetical protein
MLPVCKNTEQKKKKARKQGAERVGAQLHCVLLWRAVPFSFIIWPRANPPIPPTDTHSLSPQNSPSPENSPDSLCCEVAAVSRLGETPLRFPLPPPQLAFFSANPVVSRREQGEPLVELKNSVGPSRARSAPPAARFVQVPPVLAEFCFVSADLRREVVEFWFTRLFFFFFPPELCTRRISTPGKRALSSTTVICWFLRGGTPRVPLFFPSNPCGVVWCSQPTTAPGS